MEQQVSVSPAEQRFIEAIGVHFEALGVPRIGGRMFGLLLIAQRPLTLDEIAEILVVSRASVSTNSRLFLQLGLLEPRTIAGDRRRFFVFARRAWEQRLELVRGHARELAHLIAQGQEALGPDNPEATDRLSTAASFATYMETALDGLVAGWRTQQLERSRKVS